jgi:hypothetical protein
MFAEATCWACSALTVCIVIGLLVYIKYLNSIIFKNSLRYPQDQCTQTCICDRPVGIKCPKPACCAEEPEGKQPEVKQRRRAF